MSSQTQFLGVQIGKYLLGLCVVGLIFAIGFSQVTEYNTLKPLVNDLTKNFIEANPGNVPNQTIGQQLYTEIKQECRSKEKVEYPFISEKLVLDCKEVQAGGIPVISASISQLMLKDYYKKYDCTPLGCILDIFAGKQGNFTYIYSEQMNSFLKTVIPLFAIGAIAGIILIYYSTKKDIFLSLDNIGKTLLSSGIPFLVLMILIYKDQLLVSTGILSGKENFMRSANDFFSGPIYSIMNLFLYLYGAVFITGIACIVAGFVGIKYYKKTSYKKYMADHGPQPQFTGGPAQMQTSMRYPDVSGNMLNFMLENEYKELLFAIEELPAVEKIPEIKEILAQKKEEVRRQNQIMASQANNDGTKMILSSNEKFAATLESLIEDINNNEKNGKSVEEIIKHIRQVLTSRSR